EVLLLKRLQAPGQLQLLNQLRVAIPPLERGEIRPPDMARDEVLTIVSHDSEKSFVGLQNPTVEMPDEDADNVGVDQAPNFRLALLQCLLGAFAFRDIHVCADYLDRISLRVRMMADRFDVFDCSIG